MFKQEFTVSNIAALYLLKERNEQQRFFSTTVTQWNHVALNKCQEAKTGWQPKWTLNTPKCFFFNVSSSQLSLHLVTFELWLNLLSVWNHYRNQIFNLTCVFFLRHRCLWPPVMRNIVYVLLTQLLLKIFTPKKVKNKFLYHILSGPFILNLNKYFSNVYLKSV